jgi:hypothetical protein
MRAGPVVTTAGEAARRVSRCSDTDGLLIHLHRVQVPPGVEGVADIVAAAGDGHAGFHEFMEQRDAPPARGQRRTGDLGDDVGRRPCAPLQVEIAERQGNDVQAGLAHEFEGAGGA